MKKSALTKLIIALMLISSMIQSEMAFAGKDPIKGNVIERIMPTGDPNLDPNWDWTVDNAYWLYWGTGQNSGQAKRLPYFEGNCGIYPMLTSNNVPDIAKANGWELFARDFGTPTGFPTYPYFILYNKYRGILRVFLYNGTGQGYNHVFGELAFNNPATSSSALFALTSDDKCFLNDFDGNYKRFSMGVAEVFPNDWLFVDFDVKGYDPNTGSLPLNSMIDMKIWVRNNSMVELNGTLDLHGMLQDANLATRYKNVSGVNTLEKVTGSFLSASKNFKTLSSGLNDMTSYANSHPSAWWSSTLLGLAQGGVSTFVPGIGALAGFITSFTGSKSANHLYIPLQWRHDLTGTFNVTGTLTTSTPFFPHSFVIPGAPTDIPVNDTKRPFYSKPLGIYNVLSKPTLEYNVYSESAGSNCVWQPYPIEAYYCDYNVSKSFSLQNPLNISFNSQSGLNIISTEVSLIKNMNSFGGGPSLYLPNNLISTLSFGGSFIWNGDYSELMNYVIPDMINDYENKVALIIKCNSITNPLDTLVFLKVYPANKIENQNLNKPYHTTTISGPTTVYKRTNNTWFSNIYNGHGPYTYKWFKNGTQVSTAQNLTMNSGTSSFTLRLEVTDTYTNMTATSTMNVTVNSVIDPIEKSLSETPNEFKLHGNYPNPFNPTTTIKFDLKEDSKVTLKIYNTLGQEVRSLVNDTKEAGYHSVLWDGKNNQGSAVPSGLYIYRINAGNYVKSMKMMLVK